MDKYQKLTIKGFDDPKYEKKSLVSDFKAHINPESYEQSVQIYFSEFQAQGTSLAEGKYSHTDRRSMSFDLLLDRTGALGNASDTKLDFFLDNVGDFGNNASRDKTIEDDVKHFKELTLNYEGAIHKPRYLLLLWGTLHFPCQLESLKIEYKMFDKSGVPLRAILKTTFLEFMEEKLRTKKERKSSPDLTHIRTVKEGDTLPMMTHAIYGDASYYLEVARVNNILNFRKLTPGQDIYFPPIEKSKNAN